ncbi:MAG: proline--tRNA ligase [Clostridiales bacterium]|nr:proline--tRNA ligase [Clostridiales bacterium]
MRLSEEFFYTLRENASDEDSVSGNLLVRAGYITKVSNGVYAKLPLGIKVAENIKEIVRNCMNEKGATEVAMPFLIPIEIFEKTGRADNFGSSMFTLHDRVNRKYALGPTDEEMFALVSLNKVKSYKDLPYTIYQIGTKFRDEMRPRLGLIRTREFTMKDAYSFDTDLEGLDKSYQKMFDAYKKIFETVGLDFVIVTADTGVMGGMLSEEFQAISDTGEDILVLCDSCDYASNIEISKNVFKEQDDTEEKGVELVETPNKHTIEEVCEYLNLDVKQTVKAMLMNVDNELVVLFIRGDRELNESKVLKLLNAQEIAFANDELIATSNAVAGYTGPIGLNAKIVVDSEVLGMKNFCCGANKEGYHYINANIKDFNYDITGDIVNVKEGDICPKCGGKLVFKKGIEVGNTFKLGTKYSEGMGLNYLDKDNKLNPVVMGSYGIGIERIAAAIVEQNNDEKGIIWPISVAPYKVAIVVINPKDEAQKEEGEKLYKTFNEMGIDTIIDDRAERPGVKFNDIDLIGIPIRITVGKKIGDNIVELKLRNSEEVKECKVEDVVEEVNNIIKIG